MRVSGAALNQSRSASGVYTGLTSEMPRKGQDMFFVLPPLCDGDKTHGTRCVFGVPPTRRGHSKTSWSGHGPDTRTLLRLSAARELSGCFDVREGQRQRRLNRWLRSLRSQPPLPGGVVTARQGFAGAANAPLTGFHSNERSPWSGGGSSSVPVVGMSLGSMIGI